MRRTPQLRKQYRRAGWLGLGLSVIVHAALFAVMRFDVVVLPSAAPDGPDADFDAASIDDAATPAKEDVMHVVAIQPVSTQSAPSSGGAGVASSSAAGAPPSATARATAPSSPFRLAASTEAEDVSFDRLAMVDPLRPNDHVTPTVLADLPPAETTPVVTAADEESSYVPGSIGKAKRDWADDGRGETDLGRGIGWGISTGAGGDHCPAPGGAPGLGPVFVAW